MSDDPTHPFKSGFIAVVGRPNVGKSTLINHLLGQKIAAVSPKPQTTRRIQLGILTTNAAQLVFMDTPGIHKPVHKLGEFMNEAAAQTLKDADVILWMVDASVAPNKEDQIVAERLQKAPSRTPILLALNKIDLVSSCALVERQAAYQALLPRAAPLQLSAARGDGIELLTNDMIDRMPPGKPFFSEDQVTDLYEREIASELIREAALLHLRDEVPHSIAVRMDEYQQRDGGAAYIAATLLVERDSQKGIVIGKGGEMLKAIGMTARREIESMSGCKVFLELRVKVNKNWRDDPFVLKLLGYISEKQKKS
jgi:GTP-binding protein Era